MAQVDRAVCNLEARTGRCRRPVFVGDVGGERLGTFCKTHVEAFVEFVGVDYVGGLPSSQGLMSIFRKFARRYFA